MHPLRIKSITEAHRLAGMGKPSHPLISLMHFTDYRPESGAAPISATFDFYAVSLKRGCNKLKYGQQRYDFDEGVLAFLGPGQVLSGEDNGSDHSLAGWMLLIHPDLLWNTPLAKKIRHYPFFGYATHEALFLSDREETLINNIVAYIEQEYNSNLDSSSQEVMVAQLELLFTYATRFYRRQFLTRKIANHEILTRLEGLLDDYFGSDDPQRSGLPTVGYLADGLNMSPKYLSSMLRELTGQTALQHIHERLVRRAKEDLSTTSQSISEIAYALGFEQPQSFSKFFRQKTKQSPMEFRSSFN